MTEATSSYKQPEKAEAGARRADVILYDGSCRMCSAQAAGLELLSKGRVLARPLQDEVPYHSGITEAEALEEIKLVTATGRVYGGAEALVRLINRGYPLLAKPLYIYYLPGLRRLLDAAYSWLAANRYRFTLAATDNGEVCDEACRRCPS